MIAIIAILASILFPVFAQARDSARQSACLSNTKQVALAAMQYAQDYDETFPRHDNNGSCGYGESPCATPDWGDLSLSPAGLEASKYVMYFGALQPYIKNTQVSVCPSIGRTKWASAIANKGQNGLVFDGPYDPAKEDFYYNTLGQMAINMYVIDYGVPANRTTSTNNRPGAPRGRLAAIQRPSDTILFVAESSWGWGTEVTDGIGNGAVWPSMPGSACESSNAEGWTRYIHKGGSGTYSGAAADRLTKNPNYQGFANFGFCDGHVKAMKHSQAEKCAPLPAGATYTNGGVSRSSYYPLWTPEI